MPSTSKRPLSLFQLRADHELLHEVKELANKRQVSANRLLVDVITTSLQAEKEREKEQEWREGFEAMGRGPDINSVEHLLPAAQEVLFGR